MIIYTENMILILIEFFQKELERYIRMTIVSRDKTGKSAPYLRSGKFSGQQFCFDAGLHYVDGTQWRNKKYPFEVTCMLLLISAYLLNHRCYCFVRFGCYGI